MLLPFLLANNTVNDADDVNTLLLVHDAILDGGITPANLADDFTLDAQTQLTNNKQEITVSLSIPVTAALTTGYKAYHTLIAGGYTVIGAYLTTQLTGAGAPTGTGTLTVVAGVYTAGAFVTANTVISSTTFYSATPTATSANLTGSISTSSQTGAVTLALNITAVPSVNPPTAGFMQLTLVLKRALQA